jgi:16S rRNA (guanine966-N2)-methyltransferase
VVRITGGQWRGRRLEVPPGMRPTTELARKAAFDMLGQGVTGARVLDAAAGSGAYGLEALSRGASRATFVEADRKVRTVLERNVAALGAAPLCDVRGMTVSAFVASVSSAGASPYEVVFHDPPFADDSEDDLRGLLTLLAPGGTLVHETGGERGRPPGSPAPDDVRRYGATRLLIFRRSC